MKYKVKSVNSNDGVKIITYIRFLSSGAAEELHLRTTDRGRPELYEASKKIKQLLLKHFSTFKFAEQLVSIHAISFKYGEGVSNEKEISSYKLTGKCFNKNSYKCKIETDYLQITKEDKDVREILDEFLYEIERFIDGDRAQQCLFYEEFTEDKRKEEIVYSKEMTEEDEAEFDAVITKNDGRMNQFSRGTN